MRILIAPNAFKDSLTATEAAEAISAGLEASRLDADLVLFPVADGGDGTGALLAERLGAEIRTAPVHDPLGRPIEARFGLADRLAVIEMADAAGLRLLSQAERDPLKASSFGAGELVRAGLEAGAARIVLCVGGSATVDGGVGLLQALGFRFLGDDGEPLTGLPASLTRLDAIAIAGVRAGFTVLCDVENPILGPSGAARVYGPQKGATPEAVERLEAALARLCEVIRRQTGEDVAALPRGGAAGGVAAPLHALLGAELVRGIDYFLDAARFDAALADADLVITGEGRVDGQTLQGKAPMGVAARAKARAVPVAAFAGQVVDDPGLADAFDAVVAIGPKGRPLAEALARTSEDLTRSASALGDAIADGGIAVISP